MSLEELKVISKILYHIRSNYSSLFSHISDVVHLNKCFSFNASRICLTGKKNKLSYDETAAYFV